MKPKSLARFLVLGAAVGLSAQAALGQTYAPTLLEFLQNDGRFTTFLHLARASGSDSWLKSYTVTGCTVVAPTDDAFSRVPATVMTALAKNHAWLAKVIQYHIVPREESASEIRLSPKTVEGDVLTLTGGVPKRTARIISPDLIADNGKVQIIDQVLFPPSVFLELQRDGDLPIATGLAIHAHMTQSGVVTASPLRSNSYTTARKRKKARWTPTVHS